MRASRTSCARDRSFRSLPKPQLRKILYSFPQASIIANSASIALQFVARHSVNSPSVRRFIDHSNTSRKYVVPGARKPPHEPVGQGGKLSSSAAAVAKAHRQCLKALLSVSNQATNTPLPALQVSSAAKLRAANLGAKGLHRPRSRRALRSFCLLQHRRRVPRQLCCVPHSGLLLDRSAVQL